MRTPLAIAVCILGYAGLVHPLSVAEDGAVVKTEACSFLTKADIETITGRPVLIGQPCPYQAGVEFCATPMWQG